MNSKLVEQKQIKTSLKNNNQAGFIIVPPGINAYILLNNHLTNLVKKDPVITVEFRQTIAKLKDAIETFKQDIEMEKSRTYSITANDLTNGKRTIVHNFNDEVDISVYNQLGEEIEISITLIDKNTVELDFESLTLIGVWKAKIES